MTGHPGQAEEEAGGHHGGHGGQQATEAEKEARYIRDRGAKGPEEERGLRVLHQVQGHGQVRRPGQEEEMLQEQKLVNV